MREPREDVTQSRSEPRIARSVLQIDRAAFLASSGVSDELISQTSQTPVLLVPDLGTHGVSTPTFPSRSDELFLHLRDVFGNDVDIALTDEDYTEVSLREDLLTLPTVLTTLPLSVVGNAIWDWIKLRLGRRLPKARVKAKFVSIDQPDARLRVLEYEGPAEHFLEALTKIDPPDDKQIDNDLQDS